MIGLNQSRGFNLVLFIINIVLAMFFINFALSGDDYSIFLVIYTIILSVSVSMHTAVNIWLLKYTGSIRIDHLKIYFNSHYRINEFAQILIMFGVASINKWGYLASNSLTLLAILALVVFILTMIKAKKLCKKL